MKTSKAFIIWKKLCKHMQKESILQHQKQVQFSFSRLISLDSTFQMLNFAVKEKQKRIQGLSLKMC